MSTEPATKSLPLIPMTPLPQVVPSRVCLTCEVCCRFPEADSFLRPYFTAEEIRRAVDLGLNPAHFPDPLGGQVRVVPHPHGEGYLCPAFDPTTSHCRIYEARPLDCQIYPLAVMWNADRTQVVLGWDSKCPFLREMGIRTEGRVLRTEHLKTNLSPESSVHSPEASLESYAERIAGILESDDKLKTFQAHPRLIGRFQDDVVILRPLLKITETVIVKGKTLDGTNTIQPARSHVSSLTSHIDLTPLTHADRPRLEQAMAAIETPLAAYAYAPHAIWRGLFSYWKAEIAGALCLFAEYADGLFMPLPPLGRKPGANPAMCGPADWAEAVAQAFALMRERNRGSGVSRIENVPEEWKPGLEALGYRVAPKDPDYLYRTSDLVRLAGDRFKSQRAAYNNFARTQRFTDHPYGEADEAEGLALYHDWAAQQAARRLDPMAGQMVHDAESAHREALAHSAELGLIGRVVRVDGALRAYTFGYEHSRSVFTVLLEVADRRVTGLAQYIFREFCRDAEQRGFEWVNTMDDSGLQTLARSKMAYRPSRLVPSFIVTDP